VGHSLSGEMALEDDLLLVGIKEELREKIANEWIASKKDLLSSE
jgi:hypothetical protein